MTGAVVVARPDGHPPAPSHPVLGTILDLGSYGSLPVPPGDTAEDVLRSVLAEVDPDGAELARRELDSLHGDAGEARAELESMLERGFVLLAVLEDESLVVALAGGGLPSMGPLPPLTPELLRRSLEYALGRRDSLDGTAFAEPAISTADEERRLRERLHELYGE